ncbi:MAG: SAM-dependent methyltransferase [Gammaproteobacteria bacterium]|nr:MAG: SAM-dependent methyltransferase [Gammaproteobacteria bacterium]
MSTYLQTTQDVYREAALSPDTGLCCTTTPIWQLPELNIPPIMLEMNYGCGSTTHPRDLINQPSILYVGVGGGMEVLQFAYFSRRPGAVIGIDPVDEMRAACAQNLRLAEQQNPWFKTDFVDLRAGDALNLPLEANSIDVAAQNCLFNIFDGEHLDQAIAEMYRVLKPHGRLVLSDPVCEQPIPDNLRGDERLRALCLSGAIPMQDYIKRLTDAGFGTIEVRAKRPYRVLDTAHYDTERNILIESVEICAIKDPLPADGPCIFTGRTAIYLGNEEIFDDGDGHVMTYNQPIAICDKTAAKLQALNRPDLYLSEPSYFYDGGGCC